MSEHHLNIDVRVNADDAQRNLADTGREVGRLANKSTAAGDALRLMGGALAAVGLSSIASDALNTYRSFESMQATLKTMTGSAANAQVAFAEIQKFASTTPYTLDQSVQGFVKLKALGLDPSMDSLRSYGNTASAMGKDLMQMVEAVADASTGEFERLKEFGIKASKQGENVAFTFQGVTKTVGNNSKDIQDYLLNIGNTTFGTAMSDQAETLNGKISNLKDSWAALQVQIIENTGVADMAKASIAGLADILSEASAFIQSAATEWAFFKDSLQFSDEAPFVILRSLGDSIAWIGEAIAPALPYVGEFMAVFAGSVATFTLVAGGVGLVSTTFGAMSAAVMANPVGATIAAIGAAAYLIYDNWDGVSAFFTDLWAGTQTAASTFADWWSSTTFDQKLVDIDTTALETAQALSETFFEWWDNSPLKPIVLEVAAEALDYAQQAAEAFGTWWDSWTVKEVVADVTAETLIWAWEKSQAFAAWWDSWSLFPKEGSVDTSLIEKAWGYVQSFVEWWNSISLKDLASGAMSVLNSVKSLGSDIIDGLSDGISRATSHIDAAKKAAGQVESTMRNELDTHSPSRVLAEVGKDSAAGLAVGLDKGAAGVGQSASKLAKEVEKEAKKAADAAAKEAERIADAMTAAATNLTALSIEYNQGATAAEVFRKEQDGMSTAQAAATVVLEEQSDKLKELIKNREAANDAYEKALESLDDEHAKLTLSTEDYQRHKLEIQGVIGAKADEVIARQQVVDKLKAEQKAQKEADQAYKKASNDLLNVFENAIMDGKDLFSGFTNWVKNLFSEMVLKPVLQPITNAITGAMMPGQGAGGLGGISASVSGLWGQMQAGGWRGAATAAGAAGGLVGLLGGSQNETIGASIGAGIGNVLLPGIGGVIGGAIGTLAGSLLGGKWETSGAGLELQYGGGDVSGKSYTEKTKKGGLLSKTKRKTEYSELESALDGQLDGYFDAIEKGIVSQSSSLVKLGIGGGETAAAAIIDGFTVSMQKLDLTGKSDAERQAIIDNWANGIADDLYRSVVGADTFAALDALAVTGESTGDTFARLVTQFTTLETITRNLDLQFIATGTSALTAANSLAGVFGGLDKLTAATDYYYTNFFTEEERKAKLMQAANDDLATWNSTLGRVGAAAIDTQGEMREYISSLDLTTDAGQKAYHAAMRYAQAVMTVAGAQQSAQQSLLADAQQAQQAQQSIFGMFSDGLSGITSGLDRQLSALESSYSSQINAYKQAQDAAKGLREALFNLKSGDLTTLSPVQQLEAARAEFERLKSAAGGGDAVAAGKLESAGEALLRLSREYNASSADYAADFALVESGWESVAGLLEDQRDPQRDLLAAQQDAIAHAARQTAELGNIFGGILGGNALLNMLGSDINSLPPEIATALKSVLDGINPPLKPVLTPAQDKALALNEANKITDLGGQLAILYQILLDRAPDKGGFDYWMNELKNNGLTISMVADNFINSTEYKNSHATGLYAVPYDNYKANLHAGEAVIDAASMSAMRKYGIPLQSKASGNNIVVNVDMQALVAKVETLTAEVRSLRSERAQDAQTAQQQRNSHIKQSSNTERGVIRAVKMRGGK